MKFFILAASLTLAACATNSAPHLRPLEIATAPYRGVVTSAVTGSLMYESNCLLFWDEANRLQFMPVWPDGSSFNGTAVTFHVPGKSDQRIILAEEVQLEGQPLSWSRVPGPRSAVYQRQCGAQPFAVLRIHPAN